MSAHRAAQELTAMQASATLVGMLDALNADGQQRMARAGITAFAGSGAAHEARAECGGAYWPHLPTQNSRLSINRVCPSRAAANSTSASPDAGTSRSLRLRTAR